MLNLQVIELLLSSLALGLAYTLCVTTAGYFQAWAAQKVGDDTPEQLGFLTWNPVVHIDPFGALCLLLIGVGWGRFIPINYHSVSGTFNTFILFLSKSFAYFTMAFVSLVLLIGIFGSQVLEIVRIIAMSGTFFLTGFAKIYPESPSLVLAGALVLVMIVYLSVMLGVLNAIVGGFRFIAVTFFDDSFLTPENSMTVFLVTLVLMILFANILKSLVVYAISYAAYGVAKLFGAS